MTHLLLLMGCSAAHRAVVADRHASTTLANAAEAYWFALRWNDANEAGRFLDTPQARLAVTKVIESHSLRLSDASVLSVEVGPVDPTASHPRDGVARVHVEAYAAAGTRLQDEVIEQNWFQTAAGAWLVDTARSPVTTSQLW